MPSWPTPKRRPCGTEQRADDVDHRVEHGDDRGGLGGAGARGRGGDREGSRSRAGTARPHHRRASARRRPTRPRAGRDVERLKGLLAKDEVSQQQYDTAAAAAEASRAGVDSARAQAVEAEADIRVAESRLVQARAGEQQATAGLRSAQTVPEQMTATRARAASAQARVEQSKASLAQAELNLKYATVTAPTAGVIARKSVNPGQVVQPGQPLFAIVQVDDVWVTANFKETQLAKMRPGQSAGDRSRRLRRARVHRQGRQHRGSDRRALQPAAAGKRDRQLRQGRPARAGEDRARQGQDAELVLRPGMSVTPTVYTR